VRTADAPRISSLTRRFATAYDSDALRARTLEPTPSGQTPGAPGRSDPPSQPPQSARGFRSTRGRAPIEAPEVYGRGAIARIVRALPPIERAYSLVRFSILRPKLLSVMDLLLTDEGRILDVGCGFGLFAAYFGQTHPRRRIVGVDPSVRRIALARGVAQSLGLRDHSFVVGDVRTADVEGPFDAIYVLDVMHHLPREDQEQVLERLRSLLVPGGILLMKDITTEPAFGLFFTEALDRLMVGWREPLAYRHHREWGEMLTGLGFKVRMVRVPDVLPYPHVVIAARKT
jgi:2-polyprenyl-3-methyl-5-hydroxy-6-metoxy-1,4-benzoquinol methylase